MNGKYKIKIADTEEVDFFKIKVKIVLKEIAEYKNNPHIENCFVSDLSCIGDFFALEQEKDYLNFIKLLEDKYKIKINTTDYLIDVVKKLNKGLKMEKVKIKLLNKNAKIPTRANSTDAGADLYSIEDVVIEPGRRQLIKTGISIEIPGGHYGRIAPRSGLALKSGLDVFAGVVDESYRGEIGVVLFNSDKYDPVHIEKGDRIAQIIFERYYNFDFELVFDDLSTTDRGSGGFGSSGE